MRLGILVGVVILVVIAVYLVKSDSRSKCLEAATSTYQKELSYQTSLYSGNLPPQKTAEINQHYTDYQKSCE